MDDACFVCGVSRARPVPGRNTTPSATQLWRPVPPRAKPPSATYCSPATSRPVHRQYSSTIVMICHRHTLTGV
jgi:hypothetical protein